MMHTFEGPDGLKNFLNPFLHEATPLVELPPLLNPFYSLGIHIHAKLLHMLPLGNVKSLPAFQMLQDMDKTVDTIVESSSGNTIASLAVLGRSFGIQKTKAFVSHDISKGKLSMLQLFGVEVEVRQEDICPNPEDPMSSINQAREAGKKANIFNPDQYANEANPRAHTLYTGPQIFAQRNGEVSLFAAGLGTTGTVTGTGSYLKKHIPHTKILGVVRSFNNPVPGVRTASLLKQISFHWKDVVDETCLVGTRDAFEESLQLIRHGLVVGPSSGFALAGVKKYITSLIERDALNELPLFGTQRHVVFICCDTPYPYMDEYFTYLPESSFPLIKNAHFLQDTVTYDTMPVEAHTHVDKTPMQLYEDAFEKGDAEVILRPGIRILDLREQREYETFHIPEAQHVSYGEMRLYLEQYKHSFAGHTVYLICDFGRKSRALAEWFQQEGNPHVFSLQGGMIAWFEEGLPRVKAHSCASCTSK